MSYDNLPHLLTSQIPLTLDWSCLISWIDVAGFPIVMRIEC